MTRLRTGLISFIHRLMGAETTLAETLYVFVTAIVFGVISPNINNKGNIIMMFIQPALSGSAYSASKMPARFTVAGNIHQLIPTKDGYNEHAWIIQ